MNDSVVVMSLSYCHESDRYEFFTCEKKLHSLDDFTGVVTTKDGCSYRINQIEVKNDACYYVVTSGRLNDTIRAELESNLRSYLNKKKRLYEDMLETLDKGIKKD